MHPKRRYARYPRGIEEVTLNFFPTDSAAYSFHINCYASVVNKLLYGSQGVDDTGYYWKYEGECTLIEVKASSGNVKSTKTILAHPEKYHVHRAIKLCDVNIGQSGQMTILPLYMAFLLAKP